ncbi:protein FAR1-RELATED SEQUENCE 5-like [Arachis hypogaea]|uniref:protein FAR1-RELATED SEQUENCE 5-like n=1 Tax=Arachis hypogaea TaxID=3818 RepID=UPI000DEC13CF|nr:protein FAR1-RELATED SEQUENCE 5-like [Arachis hypogaea]
MKDVGLWTISKVVLNHSHLCCPDQAEMLKQHRELSMFMHRTIETHEEVRIRPNKTYQSFVAAAGSHRELGFIEKDVKNYITREVQNIYEEDDAKEFGKSRAVFDYFGDVVSFDTTYNTNRYNLVLGSLVGVNHHGKAPKGILTDQCASIQRAIELCMPTIIYRWCIWHIMKKIPSKLNGYKGHIDIEQEMSHVVWNSYTKDEFDINWNDFLTKHGLGGNKWLLDLIVSVWFAELYENRHIWIPVYLDHHFWAGMRSTQRSESMHSFFNKFIIRNSSLRQFVKQFDNCLASREQAEREFNAANFHAVIPCTTKSAMRHSFSMYIPMRSLGKCKLNLEVK